MTAKKKTTASRTTARATPRKALTKTRTTASKARPARQRKAEATAEPPGQPVAGPRRVIFIDVENTSSEDELIRVLDGLGIERLGVTTELLAIGNWRVVGQGLGRALAQRGAQLVHSAPATRVPDWSDLWIAVHAGMWLGRARPGDVLDIVSHDRAFDAVGDAATRLGVHFRRVTYRSPHHAAPESAAAALEAPRARRRRRRGGRGQRSGAAAGTLHPQVAPAEPAEPPRPAAAVASHDEERHAASQDQIRVAIAQLTASDPERGCNLDRLTVALKAAGFQRPPGSPRLMTRLRRMKDIEILPSGRVRLVGPTADVASAALAAGETGESASGAAQNGEPEAMPAEPPGAATQSKRRSRRRGGRRRSGRARGDATVSPPA